MFKTSKKKPKPRTHKASLPTLQPTAQVSYTNFSKNKHLTGHHPFPTLLSASMVLFLTRKYFFWETTLRGATAAGRRGTDRGQVDTCKLAHHLIWVLCHNRCMTGRKGVKIIMLNAHFWVIFQPTCCKSLNQLEDICYPKAPNQRVVCNVDILVIKALTLVLSLQFWIFFLP